MTGPARMCAVCRKRLPKAEMERLVQRPGWTGVGKNAGGAPEDFDEAWTLDERQRLPGRGIYLCGAECREKFSRPKFWMNLARRKKTGQ